MSKQRLKQLEKTLEDLTGAPCPTCAGRPPWTLVANEDDPIEKVEVCPHCKSKPITIITGVSRLPNDPLPDEQTGTPTPTDWR